MPCGQGAKPGRAKYTTSFQTVALQNPVTGLSPGRKRFSGRFIPAEQAAAEDRNLKFKIFNTFFFNRQSFFKIYAYLCGEI